MLSYKTTNHKPDGGSGMGRAPAIDEVAKEQEEESTDQDNAPRDEGLFPETRGGEAACSQPKPFNPVGHGANAEELENAARKHEMRA